MPTIQIKYVTMFSILHELLERAPTDQEMQKFAEYLEKDVWDWVRNIARTFIIEERHK